MTRRHLLSLDVVLDHLEMAWLAPEQEKVACFEHLGIGPDLLPRRIYAGRARGRVQYFPSGWRWLLGRRGVSSSTSTRVWEPEASSITGGLPTCSFGTSSGRGAAMAFDGVLVS